MPQISADVKGCADFKPVYKWFANGEGDECSADIEKYVVRGGTYGMSSDKEKIALAQSKGDKN